MATTDDKSSDLCIGIRAARERILELFEEDSLNSAFARLCLFLSREEVRWTYKGVRGQPRPGYTLEQEVDLIWETPDLLTVSETGSKVSRVTSHAGEPPAAVQVWGIGIRPVDLIARAKVLGAPKQPRPRDLPTAVRFAELAAVELQDVAHFTDSDPPAAASSGNPAAAPAPSPSPAPVKPSIVTTTPSERVFTASEAATYSPRTWTAAAVDHFPENPKNETRKEYIIRLHRQMQKGLKKRAWELSYFERYLYAKELITLRQPRDKRSRKKSQS